jgi:hypothetical protein
MFIFHLCVKSSGINQHSNAGHNMKEVTVHLHVYPKIIFTIVYAATFSVLCIHKTLNIIWHLDVSNELMVVTYASAAGFYFTEMLLISYCLHLKNVHLS